MTYFGAIGDFDGDTCVFGLDMTEDAIKKAQEQLDDILNPEKKENRSLKEKVDNLGKTLQKETIENKHLVAEIEKLKAENKNLKSSVANIMKCRDIDPIVERRAQVLANAKFKKMNSDFEDVRKAFGRTCIENDELKKKIMRLNSSAKMRDETLSDRVTNLTNELNAATSKLYLWEKDIRRYEEKIAELSTENHKMDAEIHELKQENYHLKDEIYTYQASLEEASQQNDKLGKELKECKKSFECGLSECRRLQQEVDEYRAYIDPRSYENYCSKLEEVDALRKTVDNQAETIKENNEQIQYWVAEYKKLEGMNKNLESRLTAQFHEKVYFLKEATKYKNKWEESCTKIAGLSGELENLKKSNDLLSDAYLKLCQEHVNLKKANEGLKKTNARRKKLIGNLYGKNAKLYNEYQLGMECHRKLCKEFDELNENYDKLMKAHSKLCGDYCELDKKYKSLSATKTERLDVRPPATERRGFA